jgi:hypothetical protein
MQLAILLIDVDKVGEPALAKRLGAAADFLAFADQKVLDWRVTRNRYANTDSGLMTMKVLEQFADAVYAAKHRVAHDMDPTYTVEIDPRGAFIRIYRRGEEVIHWEHTEWREDPDLLLTISNAIVMANTKPAEMDEELRRLGKFPAGQ